MMTMGRVKKTVKDTKNLKSNKPETEVVPVKKPVHRFQKGNTFGGRPKGSRNKFTELFLKDFLADWEVAGALAIQSCRLEDPSTYLRIAASLLPRDIDLKQSTSNVETILEQFNTEEELQQFLAGIRAIGAREGHSEEDHSLTT